MFHNRPLSISNNKISQLAQKTTMIVEVIGERYDSDSKTNCFLIEVPSDKALTFSELQNKIIKKAGWINFSEKECCFLIEEEQSRTAKKSKSIIESKFIFDEKSGIQFPDKKKMDSVKIRIKAQEMMNHTACSSSSTVSTTSTLSASNDASSGLDWDNLFKKWAYFSMDFKMLFIGVTADIRKKFENTHLNQNLHESMPDILIAEKLWESDSFTNEEKKKFLQHFKLCHSLLKELAEIGKDPLNGDKKSEAISCMQMQFLKLSNHGSIDFIFLRMFKMHFKNFETSIVESNLLQYLMQSTLLCAPDMKVPDHAKESKTAYQAILDLIDAYFCNLSKETLLTQFKKISTYDEAFDYVQSFFYGIEPYLSTQIAKDVLTEMGGSGKSKQSSASEYPVKAQLKDMLRWVSSGKDLANMQQKMPIQSSSSSRSYADDKLSSDDFFIVVDHQTGQSSSTSTDDLLNDFVIVERPLSDADDKIMGVFHAAPVKAQKYARRPAKPSGKSDEDEVEMSFLLKKKQ